jgi:hypothetical protein
MLCFFFLLAHLLSNRSAKCHTPIYQQTARLVRFALSVNAFRGAPRSDKTHRYVSDMLMHTSGSMSRINDWHVAMISVEYLACPLAFSPASPSCDVLGGDSKTVAHCPYPFAGYTANAFTLSYITVHHCVHKLKHIEW